MTFDTTKETMVSFLVPSQILETIDDIRDSEGNPSRSSITRRLLNSGTKELLWLWQKINPHKINNQALTKLSEFFYINALHFHSSWYKTFRIDRYF